jgi:putative endonuclease
MDGAYTGRGPGQSGASALEPPPLAPVIAGLDPAIHADAMSGYWFYVMASGPSGTLYAGVTSDLVRRVYEHKEGTVSGFTSRYDVKTLVYYERYDAAVAAIQREKNIKHWSRKWKIELIQKVNPEWRDLYEEISK